MDFLQIISGKKNHKLADKVLLSALEAEETTASGLFIAASAQEKPEFMSVAAVGPGTEKYPMTVSVGDKVIITKYSGTNVKVDGKEYTIASVKDILAVVE